MQTSVIDSLDLPRYVEFETPVLNCLTCTGALGSVHIFTDPALTFAGVFRLFLRPDS